MGSSSLPFVMHEVNIIMNQNIFWNGQAYLLCHVKCQVDLLKRASRHAQHHGQGQNHSMTLRYRVANSTNLFILIIFNKDFDYY